MQAISVATKGWIRSRGIEVATAGRVSTSYGQIITAIVELVSQIFAFASLRSFIEDTLLMAFQSTVEPTVRRVAQMNDGEIELESDVGGSTSLDSTITAVVELESEVKEE